MKETKHGHWIIQILREGGKDAGFVAITYHRETARRTQINRSIPVKLNELDDLRLCLDDLLRPRECNWCGRTEGLETLCNECSTDHYVSDLPEQLGELTQ